jgi:phage-related protein
MKKITVYITDKKYWELQKEATKKGASIQTIASTKVSTYPKV